MKRMNQTGPPCFEWYSIIRISASNGHYIQVDISVQPWTTSLQQGLCPIQLFSFSPPNSFSSLISIDSSPAANSSKSKSRPQERPKASTTQPIPPTSKFLSHPSPFSLPCLSSILSSQGYYTSPTCLSSCLPTCPSSHCTLNSNCLISSSRFAPTDPSK